jgi:peptidoglycan/LPS O-acetylase OafA/YrhL
MPRLPGVDVLRGLAVILVVLDHIHLRFRINDFNVEELLPELPQKILFRTGYYAVIIFLVISGFLITSLSLRRWGSLDRISLPHFYWLRAARILPCLLLLLTVLSVLHLAGASDFLINPERASLGRALVAALTFHLNWLEGRHGYLPGNWDVLWSLSVEETFYVLFPLMGLALRRESGVLIGMLALIVIGPFYRVAVQGQDPWEQYAYLSCMDGIAFGCIAAWVAARLPLNPALLRAGLMLGTIAVALVILFRQTTLNLGLMDNGLNVTILEAGVALILLALAHGFGNDTLSKGTALLRLAGRCSYEIYLTHMFVILGLMHPFRAFFDITTSNRTIYFTAYAAMLAGSVLLGYVVARWFSEPLNQSLRSASMNTRSAGAICRRSG